MQKDAYSTWDFVNEISHVISMSSPVMKVFGSGENNRDFLLSHTHEITL
jgi:hypothetical protein